MSQSIEGKVASEYLPILFADSAVLGALISLQVRNAEDKAAALAEIKAWIERGLSGIQDDATIPQDFRDRIQKRLENIFAVSEKIKA